MLMRSAARWNRRLRLELLLAIRRAKKTDWTSRDGELRWGIIGPGGMAEEFAGAIAREGAGRVAAVYSRSQERSERFRRRHGARASYDDLDNMLLNERGRLDVIYVATPASTHYELVRACLGAGFNVLCEKPLVGTRTQAQELFSFAQERELSLFEGMWMRCLPSHTQAGAWISTGAIGELRLVQASLLKPVPGTERSTLMDFGAYAVSFVGDLMADGMVSMEVTRHDDIDGSDREWSIRAVDSAGVRFEVDLSNRRGGYSGARIHGTEGVIEFPPQFNRTDRVILRSPDGAVRSEHKYEYSSSGFENELREVQKGVRDGAAHVLTSDKSIVAAGLIECFSSAPSGTSEFRVAI